MNKIFNRFANLSFDICEKKVLFSYEDNQIQQYKIYLSFEMKVIY